MHSTQQQLPLGLPIEQHSFITNEAFFPSPENKMETMNQ
jgi:hypothetical protein